MASFIRLKLTSVELVGAMVPGLNDGTLYSPSVAVTFGNLVDRYMAEEMPSRKSTRDSYTSIIKNHLRPRWENMVLSDIRPALIHAWFQSLKLHPVSKEARSVADAPTV